MSVPHFNLEIHRDFTWCFVVADVTYPLIDVDFLSHYGLLVDYPNNRRMEGVTTLFLSAHAASSLFPIVKTITCGTSVDSLLAELQDLTRPAGVQREVPHKTVYHIRTLSSPPVT
jgi:hypothetical protein